MSDGGVEEDEVDAQMIDVCVHPSSSGIRPMVIDDDNPMEVSVDDCVRSGYEDGEKMDWISGMKSVVIGRAFGKKRKRKSGNAGRRLLREVIAPDREPNKDV